MVQLETLNGVADTPAEVRGPDVKSVFNAMKRTGLVSTLDAFSSDWLGMHWSYYHTMGERTTIAPLMTLWKRLTDAGELDLARSVFKIVVARADSGGGVPRPDRVVATSGKEQSSHA